MRIHIIQLAQGASVTFKLLGDTIQIVLVKEEITRECLIQSSSAPSVLTLLAPSVEALFDLFLSFKHTQICIVNQWSIGLLLHIRVNDHWSARKQVILATQQIHSSELAGTPPLKEIQSKIASQEKAIQSLQSFSVRTKEFLRKLDSKMEQICQKVNQLQPQLNMADLFSKEVGAALELQLPLKQEDTAVQHQIKSKAFEADIVPKAFIIENRMVTSIADTNTQIMALSLLEGSNLLSFAVKIQSRAHFSIGFSKRIASQTVYSFKDKNIVALYTFTNGNFQGMYIQGQYLPLQGVKGNIGERFQVQISTLMKKCYFRVGDQLIYEGPLPFEGQLSPFLETYEAGQVIELIPN